MSVDDVLARAIQSFKDLVEFLSDKAKPPTKVQSVLCGKSKFKSADEARAWCSSHKFHTGKMDETADYYRFRQFEPSACQPKSFRTISLAPGVSAVICRPA